MHISAFPQPLNFRDETDQTGTLPSYLTAQSTVRQFVGSFGLSNNSSSNSSNNSSGNKGAATAAAAAAAAAAAKTVSAAATVAAATMCRW